MLYANSNVNINQVTGIRYGVIYVNKAIDLYNKILEEGEDIILSSMIKELKTDLELIESGEQITCLVEDRLYGCIDDREIADLLIAEFVNPSDDRNQGDRLWDIVERCVTLDNGGEQLYRFREEGFECILDGYTITVIQSPKVSWVNSLCSPCYPNAADLESGYSNPEEGWQCYDVPEDYKGE
jgi:hypothetical protein